MDLSRGRMAAVPRPDTSSAARRVQVAVLKRMSPEERLRIAIAMSEEAREITRSGIRMRHPLWSERQVERALLESLYGRELVTRAWGPADGE